MRMMKILLTRSMMSTDIEYIKSRLDKEIKESFIIKMPATFTEEEISKEAIDADVLLGPYVTKKILKNAKNLKLIQIPWTGMDTFNFEAVRGSIVPICNTHSNADSVAEMGVSILLDLLKKISYHDRKMRYGNWNRNQEPLNLKSKMLSKQTLCILGCGTIGYKIAKLVFAFGANVIAVDEQRQPNEVVSEVYSPDNVSIALSKANIVISSLPLTRTTRNVVNSEIVSKMIDGVIIVNMSRSAVMDEDAIYEGLVSGKISGFGADVWWNTPKRGESESYPSTHNKFWCFDNVVMSPHRAGFIENCYPHLDGAIENIVYLYKGQKLHGIVDIKNQY